MFRDERSALNTYVYLSPEVLNTWAGSTNYKVHHRVEKFEEFNKGTQLTKIYSW